jgi:uncharacterized cupredoxin-like copper-binding protein
MAQDGETDQAAGAPPERLSNVVVGAGLLLVVMVAVFLGSIGRGAGTTVSTPAPKACVAPALSGTTVQVAMKEYAVAAQPPAAGRSVSLVVSNTGTIDHELIVLPLAAGVAEGTRPVGGDERVDEASSVGESSNDCGADAGEGIAAGHLGWTTLELAPGRYELVCNLAGHYAKGMHTVLTVS